MEKTRESLDLSIVIPCSDDPLIERCLQSIDSDVDIVVALNAPTQEVRDILSKFPEARAAEISRKGIARAYNLGIETARNDHILLMDSDCTFRSGTIKKLHELSLQYQVAKGRVVFSRSGAMSSIIASLREYTTSYQINAYSPPLLFDRKIVDKIGYYFHPDLIWSEDADFDKRVKKANIPIGYDPKAVIYHKALTLSEDLRSAFFYGVGRQIGKDAGVYAPHTFRSFLENIGKVAHNTGEIAHRKGLPAAAYYLFLWNTWFRMGTFTQHYIKKYGT
ncbi:MAG: glycosyltransferase [Patescibacteria group bacterium]|nr:glycosyltransferase [Patescibacteria group bacterium]